MYLIKQISILNMTFVCHFLVIFKINVVHWHRSHARRNVLNRCSHTWVQLLSTWWIIQRNKHKIEFIFRNVEIYIYNQIFFVRESLWFVRLQVREDNPQALASGLSRPKSYNNCHIAPACICTLNVHSDVFDGNVNQRCNNVVYCSSNLKLLTWLCCWAIMHY